jgi:ADP-ribose pyrophosphatase YjhB (NUDIX family)
MMERPKGRQPIPPHAKKVFTGELFDVYQWEQQMFDGSTAAFEKLKRTDTVCVVPVLPDHKLLIIQDEQPGRDMTITFPGGRIDAGERPEEAGRRELLEETGYEAGELLPWKAIQPVSKLDWALYFFIARRCKKTSEPHTDAGERITSRAITLDELFELMDDPRFVGNELLKDFLPAKYDPAARAKLEEKLFGE